jgi:hypothetical protein
MRGRRDLWGILVGLSVYLLLWLHITWGLLEVKVLLLRLGGCGGRLVGLFGLLLLGMRLWGAWMIRRGKCCCLCLRGLGGRRWLMGSLLSWLGGLAAGGRLLGLVMGCLRWMGGVGMGVVLRRGRRWGFRWMRGCWGVGPGRLGGWLSLSRLVPGSCGG